MGTRSVLAPALLALTAPPALAADQLVKGTRLILKASIARERLSFRSRGPFILPTPGSGDDPTNVGATFQIINPNTSESFTFDLPSTHWSANSSGTSFRYVDAILFEPGKIRIGTANAPLGMCVCQ